MCLSEYVIIIICEQYYNTMPCSNLADSLNEPAHEILVIIAMVSSEHSEKPAQINHVIVAS